MSAADLALLLLAGLAGGVVSAMIGGASLFTFPAFIACDVGPLVANASTSVALTPGSFLAAFVDRTMSPKRDRRSLVLGSVALLGGAIGAVLLLVTPENAFRAVVPALLAAATLLFYSGDRIRDRIVERGGRSTAGEPPLAFSIAVLLPIAIYGGYFGAGLGVLLLAGLSATLGGEYRALNAMKNLLAGLVSSVAVLFFVAFGLVAWPQTLVVMTGALLGCWIGMTMLEVMPVGAMRVVVLTVGPCLSAWYAWRYWFA